MSEDPQKNFEPRIENKFMETNNDEMAVILRRLAIGLALFYAAIFAIYLTT